MHTQKTNKTIIPEMHLKHALHIHSPVIQPQPAMPSTQLYDKACIAAEKANTLRQAARLSVPDELHWYNNHTNWDSIGRKEFRGIMIRMETITTQFYDDYGDCMYPSRCTAIKKFWADHWGCEYLPEPGQWLDLTSNTVFKSETEKKARRDLKKAAKAKKAEEDELYVQSELALLEEEASAREYAVAKKLKAQKAAQAQTQPQTQPQNQYNDAEEELYAQALAQNATNSYREAYEEQQQKCDYDSWYDDEEEEFEEAFELARKELARKELEHGQKAEKEQREQKEQKEQEEAQAYLDSLAYEDEDEDADVEEPASRIACQPVFYIEELTDVKGDPDWRAYIYYDERTRRYVLKGTRRSVLTYNKKKTVYPELKLSFRSSKQLASYLCSSTDRVNVTMFAMACDTVNSATFAELYALPARGGYKTELYGYDNICPRYSTFLNHLRMLSDVDASRSNFAAF
jgi:hypothetical protein